MVSKGTNVNNVVVICHFTEGDNRTNEKIIAKKALCVMFYFLSKVSFRMLAKIFDTYPSLVDCITEIEFDEMWHFIKSKKQSLAYKSTR